MSRHAAEAFEGFRSGEPAPVGASGPAPAASAPEVTAAPTGPTGLPASLLTGVNPFGGAAPAAQVTQVADPPSEGAGEDGEPAAEPQAPAANGAAPKTDA